jgi:tetratricopeptide (TPR) repeat protein
MSGNKQNSVDLFLKRGARLRSITWQIAATHNPDYIVTLIDKLFNDGRTLHRRNRMGDALQRFNHALQKCNEFLQNESSARFMIQSMNASIKSIDSINNNQNGNSKLGKIRPQLRFLNCQILHTLATINLQNGDYNEALNLTAEALCYADSEPALFQLHLFRAKCFFDNRDLRNARASAQFAASLRPDNKEVQIMLSSLTTSSPLEF